MANFQQGGWYWDAQAKGARQFWNGVLGAVGKIINPNQTGSGGGTGGGISSSAGGATSYTPPPPPPMTPITGQSAFSKERKSGVFGLQPDFSSSPNTAQSGTIRSQPVISPVPERSSPTPAPIIPKTPSPPPVPVSPESVASRWVEGTPDQYKPIIDTAAKTYNIPSRVLSSLLKNESGFNPNAISPVGAIGIAQFMPDTAKGLGINPKNPEESILGAARYLRENLDKFDNRMDLALAAYNAGSGNVTKYGGIPPFDETKNYVSTVLKMANEGNIQPEVTSDWQKQIHALDLSTFEGRQKAYAIMEEQLNKMRETPINGDPRNPTLNQLLTFAQQNQARTGHYSDSQTPSGGRIPPESQPNLSLTNLSPQDILTQFKSKLSPDMIEKIQTLIAKNTSAAAAAPEVLSLLGISPSGGMVNLTSADVQKKLRKKRIIG